VLVLLLVGLLTAANLGLNDVWQPNEAFYAETAREMLERGNYLDPTYNYEPRLNKPPLVYWLTALFYQLFGVGEWQTRLTPLLSAFGTALLLFYYGKKLRSAELGLTAALVFLTALQVFSLARYDAPEMPLTFFLTGAFVFLHLYFREGSNLKLLLSGVFLALALLTKGIPFLVLYLALVFSYPVAERILFKNRVEVSKVVKAAAAGLVASVPLLGWYAYAYHLHGELFVEVFLSEVVRRATDPSKGFQPFFYLLVVLWAFLPFSLLFYYSLPGLVLRIRTYGELLFALLWTLVVFGAFTVAKGKIPVYVLPAFPAMALLTARLAGLSHSAVRFLALLSALLVLGACAFGAYYLDLWKDEALWAFTLAAVALALALRSEPLWALGAATLPLLAFFSLWVLPLVEKYRPYKEVLTELRRELPSYDLATVGYYYHNFPFYWKKKVYRLKSWKEVQDLRREKLVVFSPEEVKGWKTVKRVRLFVGSESRFLVFLKEVKRQKRFKNFYFLVRE